MFIFDLHCDTVTECLDKKLSLVKNDLQLDLTRGIKNDGWIQVFAFWLHTHYKDDDAFDRFLSQYQFLKEEINNHPDMIKFYQKGDTVKQGKCYALLAVEGGHVLGGKIDRIGKLKELGISFLTLVWNGDNEIGSGVLGSGNGLTEFGKSAVKELEKNNIIVDISHLNQKGSDEVFTLAAKPIIATHSNAREVYNHARNLYDYQLEYLIKNNGLCGVNFYPNFINGKDDCSLDEIHHHIDHILSLGGQDIIALGSDFDGAQMPSELNGIEKLYTLYENMIKWYNEQTAFKLFYDNAYHFINKNNIG